MRWKGSCTCSCVVSASLSEQDCAWIERALSGRTDKGWIRVSQFSYHNHAFLWMKTADTAPPAKVQYCLTNGTNTCFWTCLTVPAYLLSRRFVPEGVSRSWISTVSSEDRKGSLGPLKVSGVITGQTWGIRYGLCWLWPRPVRYEYGRSSMSYFTNKPVREGRRILSDCTRELTCGLLSDITQFDITGVAKPINFYQLAGYGVIRFNSLS